MPKKNDDITKLSFEDALGELETIVRDLESGSRKLDEAIDAYERGAGMCGGGGRDRKLGNQGEDHRGMRHHGAVRGGQRHCKCAQFCTGRPPPRRGWRGDGDARDRAADHRSVAAGFETQLSRCE